ncbi:unnamed protein product, partial [Mesorhabditis belari]|uniref:Uncharacterized protein n=1 Tax=Mesorhabditis belari TaxID=2138241 RepID=A0AAF3FHG1_9BILA
MRAARRKEESVNSANKPKQPFDVNRPTALDISVTGYFFAPKSIRWLLLLLCAVVLIEDQTNHPPQRTTTTDDDDAEKTTCVDETSKASGDGTTLHKTNHETTSA